MLLDISFETNSNKINKLALIFKKMLKIMGAFAR